jgi:hypothetical protein
MNYLEIDNQIIPYIIEVKNNKNTYFHFKKEGYIKINKSKHQSKKEVIQYIINNKSMFLEKFAKLHTQKDNQEYYLLGVQYEIIKSEEFTIDEHSKTLYSNNSEDHKKALKKVEKKAMLRILQGLQQKYLLNKIIDIKDISLKTRYTKTRHGSCNCQTKSININLSLIHYDYKYIEYVFLHEIAHLKIQNHQKEFYDVLVKLCPNYKETRKKLKEIYR